MRRITVAAALRGMTLGGVIDDLVKRNQAYFRSEPPRRETDGGSAQSRWTDDAVAPYLNSTCLVDLDRGGSMTGVLVRSRDGRYRMKNMLGALENPNYVVYFNAAEIHRRIRRQ